MSAFAIYRLPHADHATLIQQTEGEPAEYHLCSELNGKRGFVVAPFQVTAQQPILLIRPDKVEIIEHGTLNIEHDLRINQAAANTIAMSPIAIIAPFSLRCWPLFRRFSPKAIIRPNHTTGCGNLTGSPKTTSSIQPINNAIGLIMT